MTAVQPALPAVCAAFVTVSTGVLPFDDDVDLREAEADEERELPFDDDFARGVDELRELPLLDEPEVEVRLRAVLVPEAFAALFTPDALLPEDFDRLP